MRDICSTLPTSPPFVRVHLNKCYFIIINSEKIGNEWGHVCIFGGWRVREMALQLQVWLAPSTSNHTLPLLITNSKSNSKGSFSCSGRVSVGLCKREFLHVGFGGGLLFLLNPQVSKANEISELERYTDSKEGFTVLRPSSWVKVYYACILFVCLFTSWAVVNWFDLIRWRKQELLFYLRNQIREVATMWVWWLTPFDSPLSLNLGLLSLLLISSYKLKNARLLISLFEFCFYSLIITLFLCYDKKKMKK